MKKTEPARRKQLPVLKQTKELPLNTIAKIDPQKFVKYTTKLTARQAARIAFPIYGPRGLSINNYTPVSNTRFVLNTKTHKWTKASHKSYIRNTATYRVAPKAQATNAVRLNMTSRPGVYGFSRTRNKWIPSNILSKVAKLPLTGHKDLTKK